MMNFVLQTDVGTALISFDWTDWRLSVEPIYFYLQVCLTDVDRFSWLVLGVFVIRRSWCGDVQGGDRQAYMLNIIRSVKQ